MPLARIMLALSMIGLTASVSGCKPNRGDPWMRICDGETSTEACDDEAVIAESDDATEICYSTCPLVQMICPDSGRITVTLRAYTGRTTAFSCDWRVEERPPRPAGEVEVDSGSSVDAGDAS